ncbi:hypothetical protein CW736_12650 [Nonlabens sp. MB-3u-79]|uniref:hypothetical protein n=1 Tax=Nonlabens sp. MB-3u-79 TaxID=2058134 RepID=UPI000C312A0E|nr:hypothetical protein [Nonlabens sp. MB-3u-79]AUC80169.1 hypothetical protein CW736_12650 [Nonlabens sp. MB-3u-79]
MRFKIISDLLKRIRHNRRLSLIKNDPNLRFEMTIYQNNLPRMQVFRQATIIQFGLNIIEENGLAFFVLIGDVDKFNKAFQSTVYFQDSQKINLEGLKYVILTDSDPSHINKIYFDVFEKVFGYTPEKEYQINLKIFK